MRPAWSSSARLPGDAELQTFSRGAQWYYDARLFVHPSWAHKIAEAARVRSRLFTLGISRPLKPTLYDHEQFAKGCGCVKDLNCEKGAQMRVTLNRDAPFYKVIYTQRTSAERIKSQAKELGIERPKARNIRSVRRLNTLISITINIKALQRARAINASLLTPQLSKVS